MPGVMLYLSGEDYKLYQSLPDGKASKLFAKSLRDDAGTMETLDDISRKIESLRKENAENDDKLARLEKRRAEYEAKERELLATKEDMERRNKQRAASFLASWNSDFKAITGRDMTEQDMDDYKSFVSERQEDGKFPGMFDWLAHLKELQS